MVPMRLDAPRARMTGDRLPISARADRSHLVLKDFTEDVSQEMSTPPATHRRTRRSPFQQFENVMLGTSAAAVVLFFTVGAASSLLHSLRQSYAGPLTSSVVMISKNVSRGDTLTSLAQRYGDPQTYLPIREEQIARINHLSGAVPLVPGQHLRIPVTSPTMIAEIERSHHAVASR